MDSRRVSVETVDGYPVEIDSAKLVEAAIQVIGPGAAALKVNIFTQEILATALNRELHLSNEALKLIYQTNGLGWKEALDHVHACTTLMSDLDIQVTPWVPADRPGGSRLVAEAADPRLLLPAAPPEPPRVFTPAKGEQSSLFEAPETTRKLGF